MVAQKVTDEQLAQAIENHGSQSAAAKALGLNKRTIERRIARMRRKGWSPEHDMTHMVPDGYRIKGTSTLYDEDGKPKLQWVKSQVDHERQAEIMAEALEAMADALPKAKPTPHPGAACEALLNNYIITDYHLGMMAWGEEAGEDWDLRIAESTLVNWFFHAIRMSPDAHTAIMANIGDFLHWDGLDAVTPTNRHVLDADTRFQKVVRVAIRTIRKIVSMLLAKHPHVHIIMADANHDPASSAWLREMFAMHYEDEPRVTVDNSAKTYYCYEHGDVSLFYHHGHRKKPANISDVFAANFRPVFGRTKYSYAHMGHLHHQSVIENNLMTVEQHRTLAAKDAYAAQHGYIAGRDAKVITYHRSHGEVSRITLTPEMLV